MRSAVILTTFLTASSAFGVDNDIEKRLEALELASYTNTVSLSGFLETRYEQASMKPEAGDKLTRSLNTMLGGIDFKSQPHARVSIFGRWVFSSPYNPTNTDDAESTSSWADGRSYVDSQAYFERFFANITLLDNLQFTFGRLPTVDGPPFHFADSLPRQGSYPKWIYPVIMDGYALTYTVPMGASQNLAVRAIHSPVTNLIHNFSTSKDFKFEPPTTSGVDTTGAPVSENYRDKVDIKSFMLDYNHSGIPWIQHLNIIAQYMNFTNYQFGPMLDVHYTHQLLYTELNRIADSGLSLWLAYSRTDARSDGYRGVSATVGTSTVVKPVSIMSNDPDGSAKGKGTALGLNYVLPIETINNPSLGFEYVSNDEKYVLFELTPRQMFDLYGIHGKANHIYWAQPVLPGVKLRIGTMNLTPTHNWGYIGAPKENKNEYTSVYANLRLDF